MITYVDHLLITAEQAYELIELLDEKYKVKSQKNIEVILERIYDNLLGTEIDESPDFVFLETEKKKP